MGAWDLSAAGKQARGFPQQAMAWNFDQFKQWLDRQNNFGFTADKLRDQNIDYWTKRAQQGFPSPGQVRSTGQEIIDVDTPIQAMKNRMSNLQTGFENLTKPGDTVDAISGNLTDLAGNIQQTRTKLSDLSTTGAQRAMARDKQFSDSILGDIDTTFGNLRNLSAKTIDDLIASGKITFDDVIKDLEIMKPGGEAQTAATARAFNPQRAATLSRLRRSGVDPNSPEAAGLLSQVGTSQARAMDETQAANLDKYLERKTGLKLGKEGVSRDLGLTKLQNEIGLSTEQLGATTGEKRRTLSEQQRIDAKFTADQMGIEDQAFERTANWLDQKNNLELLRNAMERQDFATLSKLTKDMNDQEITALDLLITQYNLGQQQEQLNLNDQDKAMAKLLGISEQQYANEFGAARTAQGFNDRAFDAAMKTMQIEGQNAGWLKKMLLGMGAAAGAALLNSVAPGLGTIVFGGVGAGLSLGNLGIGKKKDPNTGG